MLGERLHASKSVVADKKPLADLSAGLLHLSYAECLAAGSSDLCQSSLFVDFEKQNGISDEIPLVHARDIKGTHAVGAKVVFELWTRMIAAMDMSAEMNFREAFHLLEAIQKGNTTKGSRSIRVALKGIVCLGKPQGGMSYQDVGTVRDAGKLLFQEFRHVIASLFRLEAPMPADIWHPRCPPEINAVNSQHLVHKASEIGGRIKILKMACNPEIVVARGSDNLTRKSRYHRKELAPKPLIGINTKLARVYVPRNYEYIRVTPLNGIFQSIEHPVDV